MAPEPRPETLRRHSGKPLVGFYWTLPVPQVGLRSLPANAAEAAKASKTIAYQRHLVLAFASKTMSPVVGEVTWMEFRPDAGTHHVADAVRRAGDLCHKRGAAIALVNFGDGQKSWRTHRHLFRALREEGVEFILLPAERAFVTGGAFGEGGEVFNPFQHFQRWRLAMKGHQGRAKRRDALRAELLIAAGGHLPPAQVPGDYKVAARTANEVGLKTLNGRPWTPDNLRLFLKAEAQLGVITA